MVDLLVIVVLEFCVAAFLLWMVWSAVVGAPWLPTPQKRVRRMLEVARVTSDDVLYDLGSGDGRIVVMAAAEFGATAIGLEIDPLRVRWSRLSIRRRGLQERAKVLRKNFFKVDLSNATVVTLYQGYEINKKIGDKLAQDLKPGARVVSYRFVLDGWTPDEIDQESSVFLYRIGQ